MSIVFLLFLIKKSIFTIFFNEKIVNYWRFCMNSEKLKLLIREHGYSHTQLAELSGVKKGTIDAWFAKDKNFNPTISELSKVASALGVSLDALVEDSDMSESESFYAKYSRHKALLAQIDKLDLKSAALINDIVEVFYRHTDKK